MAVAAEAMGYPNEKMGEFIKLVSEGKVQSREFILKFSDALRNNVRASGALDASLKTVGTAQSRLALSFQTGVYAGFKEAGPGIIEFFNTLNRLIGENTGTFKGLGAVVGAAMSGLSTSLNIISPVLSIFSLLLDRIRVMFADALDLGKTRDEISLFSSALRLLISVFKIFLGYVYLGLSSVIELSQALGTEKGGLGFVIDALAVLIGVKLVGALAKAIGKMIGLGKAATETLSKAGKAAGIATGAGAGAGGSVASAGKGLLKKAGILGMGLTSFQLANEDIPKLMNKYMFGGGEDMTLMEAFSKSIEAIKSGNIYRETPSITVVNPQLNVVNPVNGTAADAGAAAGQALADQLAASVGG